MSNVTVSIICINAKDSKMRIGPFIFDEHLNNEFIKNKIHETLLEQGFDYYAADDIEDIVVVYVDENFDGIYSPKIEDVWPSDFGPRQAIARVLRKEGEK